MHPELVDVLENGEVTIMVYQLSDESKRWWVRVGAALLELNGTTMKQLLELTDAMIKDGGV